jgi:hypothetical protein
MSSIGTTTNTGTTKTGTSMLKTLLPPPLHDLSSPHIPPLSTEGIHDARINHHRPIFIGDELHHCLPLL